MQWFDLSGFAEKLISLLERFSAFIKLDTKISLIIAAVLALVVGFLGYRLKRLVMGVTFGAVGYFAGVALLPFLQEKIAALANAGDMIKYVVGGAFAAILLILAFAKYQYAMFAAYALIGYDLVYVYVSQSVLLLVGGALLLGLLSVLLVRFGYIVLTSVAGGFTGVIFLSALLPDVAVLKLGTDQTALWIALGVSVIFLLLQYIIRPRKKKSRR